VSPRHLKAVTFQEIRHIMRDRTTLVLVTLMPIFLLFVLAYAVTADIQHVPIAVCDQDRSASSRAFIQQVTIGKDLDLHAQVQSQAEIEPALLHGTVKAAIIIPPGFERDLVAMRSLPLQVLVDGTEPQSGGFAVQQISRRAEDFVTRALSTQLQAHGLSIKDLQPVEVQTRVWFNPNLKSSVDLIPGLLSIVIALPGLSVALTLAREREHGTLEQLLATPVTRAELLVGKMTPYVVSGLINVVLMTAIAMIWFRVPFNGSFLIFMLLSTVFLFAVLGLGMIIGVFIHTQAAALALSMLVIFFPGFFLTGIFFPIEAMPAIVRSEALALPGTHYAVITRASFITGAGLDVLWPYGLALLAMSFAFTGIAAMFFRKKLA
jgi:ABC-2 type transport system permease protein